MFTLLILLCACERDTSQLVPAEGGRDGGEAVPDASVTPDASAMLDAGGVDPPPAVLTQHNDPQRTGANLRETILDTSNVNPATFGKLFSREVDGHLYAQPLFVPDLDLGGRRRNVVFVATQHNSVYAFDADDPEASAPLWRVNLGTPVSTAGYYCKDLTPEDGSLVVHRPRVRPTWLSWRRDRRGLLRCDPEDMPAGGEE